MQELTTIQLVCVFILPIIFAVTLHEVAHGYVAKLLGDKTAMILGRLTVNPLKHLDLLGTIVVPLVLLFMGGAVFGWAKPVPITVRNFRHPQRDMALVALAGPSANFLMAIIWALIAKGGVMLVHYGFAWALAIFYMGQAGVIINLVLCVLNFLPIPPLDGSHILLGILPRNIAIYYERIAPAGFVILLILLALGWLSRVIQVPTDFLLNLFHSVFGV